MQDQSSRATATLLLLALRLLQSLQTLELLEQRRQQLAIQLAIALQRSDDQLRYVLAHRTVRQRLASSSATASTTTTMKIATSMFDMRTL